MAFTESPLSRCRTELHVRRRRGLELFCLSFLALFLELMVIRWAPAVVRLIAYYANLILISSFSVWVWERFSARRESRFWMAASSAADQRRMAVDCPFHHAADDGFGKQVLHT